MNLSVRDVDLAALNSMTKYPSIPTYHALDPHDGCLAEETVTFDGLVIGTEKIDGASARIILLPDGNYLLGSRENLLYGKGDLIGDQAEGIVTVLKPIAERLASARSGTVETLYLEVYGGKTGGETARNYTGHQTVGTRLFDSAVIEDYEDLLSWGPERIARWREPGQQQFVHEGQLRARYGLKLAPRLFTVDGADLPTGIAAMHEFLVEQVPHTLAGLDDDALGKPEGIVLRTPDRTTIAKARFASYERTARRDNGPGRP